MDHAAFDAAGRPEQDAFLRRVRAVVAPMAKDRGAIVDDPGVLAVAKAVYTAYGEREAAGGLTRAQLAYACRGVCDEAAFTSRFEVFVGNEMLLPIFDKSHQIRYVLDMSAAMGVLLWDRVAERGGVDELLSLLDHTRAAVETRTISRTEVFDKLHSSRRYLIIAADHLLRMVQSSTLAELIAVRRHHSQDGLMDKVHGLYQIVAQTYPDLDPDAYRVLQATQRYVDAREAFVRRLLDEGGSSRDFSLLDHEEYLEAARTRSVAELAEVFAEVVFDPPSPWVDSTTVAEALTTHRPAMRAKERPPRPTVSEAIADPLAGRIQTEDQRRARRDNRIEWLLQGQPEMDVAGELRKMGWPGAGRTVADLLAADADPTSPYSVHLSDELIVDPDGDVSYVSPLTVARALPAPALDAGLTALVDDRGAEATRDGDEHDD